MDLASLAAANRALGNDPFAAALEITLTGPELEALQDLRLALGTDVRPIKRGDRLATGQTPERGDVVLGGDQIPQAHRCLGRDPVLVADPAAKTDDFSPSLLPEN